MTQQQQNSGSMEKRDNSGYLFENKQKTSEKQPDFRGKVTIKGTEFLISGWRRNKDGELMISLAVTDPSTLPQKEGNAKLNTGAKPVNVGKPNGISGGAGSQVPMPVTNAGKKDDGFPDLDDLDDLFGNS